MISASSLEDGPEVEVAIVVDVVASIDLFPASLFHFGECTAKGGICMALWWPVNSRHSPKFENIDTNTPTHILSTFQKVTTATQQAVVSWLVPLFICWLIHCYLHKVISITMNRRKRPRDSIAETTNHHYPPNLLSRQNIRRPTIINPSIILLWRTCSVLFFTATWVFVSWMPLPSSAASSPTATRIILEEFYDTTHGDEWDTHTNWKVSDNVCDWYGIYCDGEEEVSRIELDRNQLSGSVPSALWRLPNLKHVNLRSNRLQDAGLGGLATDDDDTDPRSPLELLILSDNQLTTLKGIGNAKDTLQFVNLNKNQIDQSIPDEVFDLTNLKTLYLAFNQFTGTLSTAIGRLTKLTELYAFRNRLSGQIPSELGMLDKCQILGMGNNLWTGTLPTELNDMVNLRDLSIHNSEDGNGEGGEYTSQQQQSTSDQQRSAGIKGPLLSFGNMPFLGLLYLDGNDLTGTIPSDFLRHNNLTDSSVSIGLSYNNLTGAIPKALERFQSLNLDLVGNSIESIPPELCEKGGWMGGQVEEYKCNAILCPLGTYSPEGREIGADSECRPCADGYPYLGATKCLTGSTNQEPWEILAGFYLAMGGDKWENKDGWEIFDNLFNGETFEELEQINIDICNGWYGILCHDGVPERLSLPNNSLFGVVPKMIFEVKWNAFDLSDNNVIVDDLTIILHPKALTSLILSNVKVNRLDGLANLGNLEQLYLDGLEIEGTIPDVLFDLTNLKTLHLQHGKFDGALSTKIGNLVNLEM
jgi:Leucine-rich repeat (LRR) protein